MTRHPRGLVDLPALVHTCITSGVSLMCAAVLILLTGAPDLLMLAAALITGGVAGLWVTELRQWYLPRRHSAP